MSIPPNLRGIIIVATLCALIGVVVVVSTGILTLTGGSQYAEFALAVVFFVSFLFGAYWWIVFAPGRFM